MFCPSVRLRGLNICAFTALESGEGGSQEDNVLTIRRRPHISDDQLLLSEGN